MTHPRTKVHLKCCGGKDISEENDECGILRTGIVSIVSQAPKEEHGHAELIDDVGPVFRSIAHQLKREKEPQDNNSILDCHAQDARVVLIDREHVLNVGVTASRCITGIEQSVLEAIVQLPICH